MTCHGIRASAHGVGILAAAPLVDGVKAAGAREHSTDGQGKDGRQGVATAVSTPAVGDSGEGGLRVASHFLCAHTSYYKPFSENGKTLTLNLECVDINH